MERSLHWYIGSTPTLINTYTAALITEQVAKKVFSPPCSDLRSFYTESTLRKVLCKPKGRAATEDKSNIPYQIDCFITVKQSAIVKRMKLGNTVEKQIITLAGIRRKLFIEKAG